MNIYHLHHQICGHATNDIPTLVEYALKHDYHNLYFTEHRPLDPKRSKVQWRPSLTQIKQVRDEIDLVNQKYRSRLHIYYGYEAEWSAKNPQEYADIVRDPLCDFAVFGNHYYGDMDVNPRLVMETEGSPTDLKEHYENAKAAIESGIFSWFAHPDIWLTSYKKWDDHAKLLTRQLITLCVKHNVVLGFNGNGLTLPRDDFNYPSKYFWNEVAKTNLRVLIEADSHHLKTFTVEWLKRVKETAIEYGLKKNLVDDIPIKFFKH